MSTIFVPMAVTAPGAIGMTVGATTAALAMVVKPHPAPPGSSAPIQVPMTIHGPGPIDMTVGANTGDVEMLFDTKIVVMGSGGTYPGPYTVTPTRSTQTLNTHGLTMAADVVVNPIPPNYGLITWDGAKLTVS